MHPSTNSGPLTRRISGEITFLDNVGSVGAGNAIMVVDYTDYIFHVVTDGGGDADLQVICRGCALQDPPADWTAPVGPNNIYSDIAMYDYSIAKPVAGSTGFDTTAAPGDQYKLYMVDVEALMWVNFVVAVRNAGEVTVKGYFFGK